MARNSDTFVLATIRAAHGQVKHRVVKPASAA